MCKQSQKFANKRKNPNWILPVDFARIHEFMPFNPVWYTEIFRRIHLDSHSFVDKIFWEMIPIFSQYFWSWYKSQLCAILECVFLVIQWLQISKMKNFAIETDPSCNRPFGPKEKGNYILAYHVP